ncbi:MAG: S8 family peptidase [Phycisphaerae bacterium]
MPEEKPLIILPQPQAVDREKRISFGSGAHFPSHSRQGRRLVPQFRQLQTAFNSRRIEIQSSSTGIVPEQVLVMETVGGIDDFIIAVKHLPGMEWLGEFDEDDIPPDDDFFIDEEHRDKSLSGRLYLVMANQQAMQQLMSLWRHYKRDANYRFPWGLAKWRVMFEHLKTIRPWGIEDRIRETGILEDWQKRVQEGQEVIRFEAELWFRNSQALRDLSQARFEEIIQNDGGRIITQSVITEVAYHGILAALPIQSVQSTLASTDTQLMRCDQIMFLRPVGQAVVHAPSDEPLSLSLHERELPIPQGEPIAAIFDGYPLENHYLLENRLLLDDPDDLSQDYPANERIHGTEMACLIIHGDLHADEEPLKRPVYIRPILRPDIRDFRTPRAEMISEDILAVDLVHRAVKRLFEGSDEEDPVAPQIRFINLSICDPSRVFDNAMSSWARLLDWLSFKYSVLFIVSAGNHPRDIELGVTKEELTTINDDTLRTETIKSIANDIRHRRLLSPAESMNSLTIGALHNDNATIEPNDRRKNLLGDSELPSPISALGLGYRRSIKPDILCPGGRQMYDEKITNAHANAVLCINESSLSPGHLVASPGTTAGVLDATRYSRGTSNAAALVTRTAVKFYDVIEELRQEENGNILGNNYVSVLTKAILVHGASWGNAYNIIKEILRTEENSRGFREHVGRFLGYGIFNEERVFRCTDQRATMIGCGELTDGEAHLYSIPLPPSLSSQRIWRRLTITLAWLTTVRPTDRKYRCAFLWFNPPLDKLEIIRQQADGRAVRRGTVQHEILEGERAAVFIDVDRIQIKVNCREEAKPLTQSVPYGLVVSLEVAEGIEIQIYNEILTRIRAAIRINTSNSNNE